MRTLGNEYGGSCENIRSRETSAINGSKTDRKWNGKMGVVLVEDGPKSQASIFKPVKISCRPPL